MKLLLRNAASLHDWWRLRCHELLVRAAHLKRLNIRAGIANIFLRRFFSDGHLRIGELLKEMGYAFDEEQLPEMAEFIFLHPGLLEDLGKLHPVVPVYFDDAQLKLNLYTDMVEKYSILFIEVIVKLPFDEAYEKGMSLKRKYFWKEYNKHNGDVVLKTDPIYEEAI